MVEVRHLKLVEAIARVGSLKEAAKELHLSQSALSHQLKQLETNLGTPVFHRTNNQLLFTPAGKEFKEAAQEILRQMQELEERVQEINKSQLRDYIHGYSKEETQRLYDQASSIEQFLHWDSKWEEGALVLEAGCGVGAQTKIIAAKNPTVKFVAVDLSGKSLVQASASTETLGINNVEFKQADLRKLPFANHHFDDVFVCFVLEHLSQPMQVLQELKRVLKPGGSITLIEGDHGSTYFYPDSKAAQNAVQSQVTLQQQQGGNPNIGRALFPLLRKAGFQEIRVDPRQIYVDDSKPELVEGIIKNTFTAMIKGVAEEVISKKIIAEEEIHKGIKDLEQTASGGGTFCYTFFKGRGLNGG